METTLNTTVGSVKAVLKSDEDHYINGFGPIIPGSELDFEYDDKDNFYILIHGERFEECSTAFDFVTVNY